MEAYFPQATRDALAGPLLSQVSSGSPEMPAYLTQDVLLRAAGAIGAIFAAYTSSLVTYRLILSPLAKFPRPKVAAVTGYYKLYYDVIQKEKHIFQIEKMHDNYGAWPIILTLTLRTLHPQLRILRRAVRHGNVRKTDRYEAFVAAVVNFQGSHLATISHDLHRKRKKPLDPSRLEPMVAELLPPARKKNYIPRRAG
ncbi:hypothetical protein BDV11DRAFT_165803 [Aspergillus similis]